MALVVKKENLQNVLEFLKSIDEPVFQIGRLAPLSETAGTLVQINNIDKWNL